MAARAELPPSLLGDPRSTIFPTDDHASISQGGDRYATQEVFRRLKPLICSVQSAAGEATGFWMDKNVILTVRHNIPNGSTDTVQVQWGDPEKPFFCRPKDEMVDQHSQMLDLYCMETVREIGQDQLIPTLPDNIPLEEGMKVYFAGYPLGQDQITLHKGTISSITVEDGIRHFTIDGTVVPGNSGGPVVIQHAGQLYLAGVITSEIADFSPEDLKITAIMRAIVAQNRSKGASPGVTQTVTIQTPDGPEQIAINDTETISLALDLIQRNLSTGIGRAIDIRHSKHLFQKEPALQRMGTSSFPVGRGKGLVSNSITNDAGVILAKFMEVRSGKKGGGNRGIRIVMQAAAGTGEYVYKFSPNPHTAPGNYNKNQPELYEKAAMKMMELSMQDRQVPQNFTFDACKHTYTANRQA